MSASGNSAPKNTNMRGAVPKTYGQQSTYSERKVEYDVEELIPVRDTQGQIEHASRDRNQHRAGPFRSLIVVGANREMEKAFRENNQEVLNPPASARRCATPFVELMDNDELTLHGQLQHAGVNLATNTQRVTFTEMLKKAQYDAEEDKKLSYAGAEKEKKSASQYNIVPKPPRIALHEQQQYSETIVPTFNWGTSPYKTNDIAMEADSENEDVHIIEEIVSLTSGNEGTLAKAAPEGVKPPTDQWTPLPTPTVLADQEYSKNSGRATSAERNIKVAQAQRKVEQKFGIRFPAGKTQGGKAQVYSMTSVTQSLPTRGTAQYSAQSFGGNTQRVMYGQRAIEMALVHKQDGQKIAKQETQSKMNPEHPRMLSMIPRATSRGQAPRAGQSYGMNVQRKIPDLSDMAAALADNNEYANDPFVKEPTSYDWNRPLASGPSTMRQQTQRRGKVMNDARLVYKSPEQRKFDMALAGPKCDEPKPARPDLDMIDRKYADILTNIKLEAARRFGRRDGGRPPRYQRTVPPYEVVQPEVVVSSIAQEVLQKAFKAELFAAIKHYREQNELPEKNTSGKKDVGQKKK